MDKSRTALASFWMIIATLLFVIANFLAKFCAEYYSIAEIVFYRSLFGLFFITFIIQKKKISIKTKFPMLHLLRSFGGLSVIALGIYLVKNMPFATAQTLLYTNALFFTAMLIIVQLYQREKIEWNVVLCVFVGFCGIFLILDPDFSSFLGIVGLIGVFTGFLSACVDWFIRALARRNEPRERMVFYFFFIGTITGALATLLFSENGVGFHRHTLISSLLLLAMGFVATFAQETLVIAWQRGHPLLNAGYQYSSIIFSLIIGIVFLGEGLLLRQGIGIGLILASGVLAAVFCEMKR